MAIHVRVFDGGGGLVFVPQTYDSMGLKRKIGVLEWRFSRAFMLVFNYSFADLPPVRDFAATMEAQPPHCI